MCERVHYLVTPAILTQAALGGSILGDVYSLGAPRARDPRVPFTVLRFRALLKFCEVDPSWNGKLSYAAARKLAKGFFCPRGTRSLVRVAHNQR